MDIPNEITFDAGPARDALLNSDGDYYGDDLLAYDPEDLDSEGLIGEALCLASDAGAFSNGVSVEYRRTADSDGSPSGGGLILVDFPILDPHGQRRRMRVASLHVEWRDLRGSHSGLDGLLDVCRNAAYHASEALRGW